MVAAISMCKDEADIAEDTLSRMAEEVDVLIVADNGSTDGTRDILARLSEHLPLTVIDDPDPAYYQSRKMSALAAKAAEMGAAWVIPHDFDERWYSPFGRVADVLEVHPEASIAHATLYDHVATAADPDGSPMHRIGWRRQEPGELPKVACRPLAPVTIHQGNHGADHGSVLHGQLIVRHFPYRSAEQFVTKARNGSAAYAATDLPEHQGAHWRQYGQLLEANGEDALQGVFREWFWSAEPHLDPSLIYDPCP